MAKACQESDVSGDPFKSGDQGFPEIILASTSPRRGELLGVLGVQHRVVASEALESEENQLTAWEVATLNAYRKARAVAKRFPDSVVLGADTVVCLGAKLFGKPCDMAEAESMLRALQGKTHQVVTGVCLIHLRAHRQRVFAETSDVTLLPLSIGAIRRYLGRIQPLDKAGAYAIQDHGSLIVSEISGSFSNVVGLPLERLKAALGFWGPGRQAGEPR